MFCVAVAAHAEECIDIQSTSAEPDFKPCEDQEPQLDLDAAIAEHPAPAKPTTQSDGVPWIAESRDLPATFNSRDSGVSIRTSLGTWRDYNARAASPTIQQQPGFATSTNALTLPKAPAAPATPIDVWSNIDVDGYDGSRDQSTRAGVGADYKISRATSVGVSVEHGDSRSVTTGVEEDQKASAYVTLQAAPMLSLDARTEWQAGNAEFATSNGATEKGAVIFAPKVNHSFALDGGTTVEPFVTYKREFDLSTARKDVTDPSLDTGQSAGAGVTYTKPDAYSLSVTADVDNVGATTEPQSLSSKFKLSVPIR